jgi:glycosyltransferase involved in cell wall biosynthesis
MTRFSILITTKNRLNDLKITLNQLACFIENDTIEFIICDDGSTDGTSDFIETNFKTIQLIKNPKSKGLIFSRNRLLNLTNAKYAITLDDDAHIVSENTLEIIEQYFNENKRCAIMALRIFWGKVLPENINHNLENKRVKGFVGCGHVWRMNAWREIPNYPAWFIFYGEEEYASYQLFKKKWEVWFIPDILVQHRVNVNERRKDDDYTTRLRRSLRSGWYLYFLFYPFKYIPRKMVYTLCVQLKLKVFKGDIKAFYALIGALLNVFFNIPRLLCFRNSLSDSEYKLYNSITDTILYWSPEINFNQTKVK